MDNLFATGIPSAARQALRAAAVSIVSVWFAIAAPVQAQRFQTDTYTVTEGLPSSQVLALTQDAEGRMWFATRAGIAVYDGVSWDVLGANPPSGRSFTIAIWDEDVRLWGASTEPPLLLRRFEDGEWTNVPAPPNLEGGIAVMDVMSEGGRPRVVVGTDTGSVWQWDGSNWRTLATALGRSITAIAVTPAELLVLCDGSLYRSTQGGPLEPIAMPPGAGGVRLAIDRATRTPWLVGSDWVARIDAGTITPFATHVALPPSSLFNDTVALGPGGGFYIGYLDRVVRVHPVQGLQSLTARNGLVSDGAVGMLRDREGNIWIATPRGASKLVSLRFASYRAEHGLLDDEVTAVLDRGNGRVALGHVGGLTFIDDTGTRAEAIAERDLRARILDLDGDEWGFIWAAMDNIGIAEISPGLDVRWHLADALPTRSVRVAHDGTVWVATQEGLYRGGTAGFEPYELPGVSGEDVRRIIRIGEVLYFASYHGLYRLENGSVESIYDPTDSLGNNTYAVVRDTDGTEWVGTGAGLMRVAGEELIPADRNGPHTERPVYFLMWDRRHRLWIGTDDGVLRWDGERLVAFSTENGLIGRETNRAAGVLDSRGRVWIGTDRGVSVYRSEYEEPPRPGPIVALLDAHVGEFVYPLSEPFRLPHRASTVVFAFRAVSLTDEHRVRVQTRLEGFEEDWLEHDGPVRNTIRYTSLPHGDYRLHLRAANAEGTWSPTVASEPIVILPPFWQRPLFFAGMGLLVAAMGYAIHHYVSQRQYAHRLEKEVREQVDAVRRSEDRLRSVQRLEALGLLAGGIAHDFNNLLTVVLGNVSLLRANPRVPREHVPHLDSTKVAIQRARELTQQLLTFSRGGEPVRQAAALQKVLRDAASLAMSGTSSRCTFDVPDDLWAAWIDIGQINQVIHNLLLNAVEAMPHGGTIRIAARNRTQTPATLHTSPYVEVEIRDEGPGIAPEHINRVFDPYYSTKDAGRGLGLAAAYSIVRRHDGLLTVESPSGGGSRFRVFLPATRNTVESIPLVKSVESDPTLGAHVLVMDDEAAVREVVGELLAAHDCTVEFAEDGARAVALYIERQTTARPFDLVLMDLTVPGGMGGKEAMERLLEFDSDACGVVASGYSNDPVMARHAEFGFRACIRKPFGSDELAQLLAQVLPRPPG